MTEQQMTQRARDHWAQWLPEKTAELKAAGRFSEETQAAGKLAAARVAQLLAAGYQEHEAAEVALAEHVLLAPEPGAGLEDWEKEELGEMERQYQEMMKEPPTIS